MRTTTAVVVALLALLGACQQPEVLEPDPSASPSATTSPAPTMPAQAREDSDEGAVAFVRYWLDVSNDAARSGSTEALEAVSDDSCEGCRSYIELYEEIHKNGGSLEGGDRRFEEAEVRYSETRPTIVIADLISDAGTETDSAGATPRDVAASRTTVAFELNRLEGGWVMSKFGLWEES